MPNFYCFKSAKILAYLKSSVLCISKIVIGTIPHSLGANLKIARQLFSLETPFCHFHINALAMFYQLQNACGSFMSV